MDQRYVSLNRYCAAFRPFVNQAFKPPDLPSDFLSTPLGAALRPGIDSMFGRPTTAAPQPTPNAPLTTGASSLLQDVSDRALGAPVLDSGYSSPSPSTSARAPPALGPLDDSAIHATTNPASFRALLGSHRAVVAMFTSATCAPCRMIEPVFEELAREKKGRGGGATGQVAFAKVDLSVGLGSMVAREYNVTATPTFGFFLDGKKVRAVSSPPFSLPLSRVSRHPLRNA
jgi:thiol-disulfide isomerase/thioredoxin